MSYHILCDTAYRAAYMEFHEPLSSGHRRVFGAIIFFFTTFGVIKSILGFRITELTSNGDFAVGLMCGSSWKGQEMFLLPFTVSYHKDPAATCNSGTVINSFVLIFPVICLVICLAMSSWWTWHYIPNLQVFFFFFCSITTPTCCKLSVGGEKHSSRRKTQINQ